MRPRQFILLAIAAIVSSVLALLSFTLRDQWSQGSLAGTRLFPQLASQAANVAAVEIKQAGNTLTLEKKGSAWGVKERGGYPVDAERVRAMMVRLQQADLMEAKTRKADRYALVELEDPTGKDAKSRAVRALDAKGGVVAELVVGKRRADAFGAGRGATWVRKPGDPQTWLASGEIDPSLNVRDWVKTQVLELDSGKIDRLTVEIDGEEPLKVERNKDKEAKVSVAFVGLPPDGKKLKDQYAAESLLRAAGSIELEDVRKQIASPAGKEWSKVAFETDAGLKVTYSIRREADAFYYMSIAASGEGDAKKQADELNARVAGWEFKVAPGKGESLLKKRADLLEASSS